MTSVWWGRSSVAIGASKRWRIGPLTLTAQRLQHEWRFLAERSDDPLDDSLEVAEEIDRADPIEGESVRRVAFAGSSGNVELYPVGADRPLVTRPEQPFHIPAGEQAQLYVGAPLWVRVCVGERAREVWQFPVFRPSDTWFGSSTVQGELCYASRTFCRLHLDNLHRRPHRVATAVTIRNLAETDLALERMVLPSPHLGLYQGPDGYLWTEDVTFERQAEEAYAALALRRRKSKRGDEMKLVAGPRISGFDNRVVRAFSSLFHRGGGS